MKICIYGAGAVGGYLGAELTLAGHDVTLIARGAHLASMRERGLTILTNGDEKTVRVASTDNPAQVGLQDYVIVTVKTHALPDIASRLVPMLGPTTAVVTAQNGIPWWYFYKLPGPWEGHRLESVDPGGMLWKTLPPEHAVGCVVYPSCQLVEPGVIRHLSGKRFMLGEPDGDQSERVTALSEALGKAGFRAPVRTRIRDDIWLKLLGNASFNPVSVLTHATLEQIGRNDGVRSVVHVLMTEAQAVAERLGVTFPVDVETRIDWGTAVGAHKTSMLQDLELGRPMEIEGLVGVVSEMGRLVAVPTPALDVVLALVRLRARTRAEETRGH